MTWATSGWFVQADGTLKFNSTFMNEGSTQFHYKGYYCEPSNRQAEQVEQNLLRRYLEVWTKDGQPVSGWKFDIRVHQEPNNKQQEVKVKLHSEHIIMLHL